jgi:predicted HicB family RNase H-like nuclease
MGEKTEAQKRAQRKYMESVAVFQIRTDKSRLERIKAHAESQGESVNAFINRAIDEAMQREGGKNDG